ncbi:MAG: hypothetical protein MUP71_12655 [Candidatus Aminicenantes bacterium]|nr:hypothetical protein [Candidatus Aminicenantes bacterium]
MKRKFGPKTGWTAMLLFFLVLLGFLKMASMAADEQIARKTDLLAKEKIMLPDLQVTQISLTRNCELQATIANIGKGGVPDSAYSLLEGVVINVFKGIKLVNSIGLKDFDPKKKLKKPGETVTHVWPARATSIGIHLDRDQVKVVADAKNVLKEANESNNELTKKLICPLKPSITITHIHPTLEEVICWYHQYPPNKFKCIIFWTTKNYFYPKIKKIVLICKMFSSNGTNYLPCNSVYTLATDVPNSGEYHFDLPYTSENIGDFELKIYGYGNNESPEYPVCLH